MTPKAGLEPKRVNKKYDKLLENEDAACFVAVDQGHVISPCDDHSGSTSSAAVRSALFSATR